MKLYHGEFQQKEMCGIPTGFKELDSILLGLRESQLVVVSGVSGVGRTSFLLSILFNICRNKEIPAAFFTLESKKIDIISHLFNIACRKNLREIWEEHGSEWATIYGEELDFSNDPLYLEDSIETFDELSREIENLAQNEGVKCFCIDTIQSLRLLDKSHMKRNEGDLHYMVYALKRLAKKLKVSIVLSCIQIDPIVLGYQDFQTCRENWPGTSGDDNACCEVADVFLQITRPEFFEVYEDENGNDLRGVVFLNIRKNRNGKIGRIKLSFHENVGLVTNLGELSSEDFSPSKRYCFNDEEAPF